MESCLSYHCLSCLSHPGASFEKKTKKTPRIRRSEQQLMGFKIKQVMRVASPSLARDLANERSSTPPHPHPARGEKGLRSTPGVSQVCAGRPGRTAGLSKIPSHSSTSESTREAVQDYDQISGPLLATLGPEHDAVFLCWMFISPVKQCQTSISDHGVSLIWCMLDWHSLMVPYLSHLFAY